ncbi:MAG: hypothetical protein HQM00_02350 [Magnetococcales bacterium]|nr:hypothetical protein [Magnetococcales bacterium]
MTPGTVLFHTEFPFSDSQVPGRKLCIVLNNGKIGYYLVVKTTSQPHHFSSKYGCQPPPARHPAFYLPQATGTFQKDTWVQLGEFFRFDMHTLLNKRMQGVVLVKCMLPKPFVKGILECAILSDDLLSADIPVLQESLRGL